MVILSSNRFKCYIVPLFLQLNMLMRLQEAANYSSPHSNDSDSVTSLDSSHTRHSEDLSSSTRGVESAL